MDAINSSVVKAFEELTAVAYITISRPAVGHRYLWSFSILDKLSNHWVTYQAILPDDDDSFTKPRYLRQHSIDPTDSEELPDVFHMTQLTVISRDNLPHIRRICRELTISHVETWHSENYVYDICKSLCIEGYFAEKDFVNVWAQLLPCRGWQQRNFQDYGHDEF